MMHVPALVSDVLSDPSPKIHDSGDADAAAEFLQHVVEGCTSYDTYVYFAEAALQQCKSEAVDLVAEKAGETLPAGASVLSESATKARSGFVAYSAEIDRINEEAGGIERRVEDQLSTIRAQVVAVEEILTQIGCSLAMSWDDPPPTELPVPELDERRAEGIDAGEREAASRNLTQRYEAEWRNATVQWHSACDEIDFECAAWQGLVAEREAAEHALLTTLGETTLGRLIALGSLAGSAGPKLTIANAVSGEAWGKPIAIETLVTAHDGLRSIFPPHGDASGMWHTPPDADRVADWWISLDEAGQETLITQVPWVIGNLPGLSFAVRDRANRLLLEHFLSRRGGLSAANRNGLDEIVRVLGASDSKPPVSLVSLDLTGDVPLAAVGYGPLDTAEHVNWQVPGMFSDVPQGLPVWDRASRNLHAEQLTQLRAAGRGTDSTGLVVFTAYDTPNLLTVLSVETAREAASRLADELDGTVAARQGGPPPHLGVIAHSYGTTVAANALVLSQQPVSSFVMVASAGLDSEQVPHLSQLNVDRDAAGQPKIYTTMADRDGIAPFGSNISGRTQPNPRSAWSQRLRVAGAAPFSSDGFGDLRAAAGHAVIRSDGQGYLDKRTLSLRSVASLSVGVPGQVPGGFGGRGGLGGR